MRFQPGNKAAAGNRGGRRQAELRKLITEKQVKTAFKKLSELVDAGEFAAIKLLLEYGYGKPVDVVDVTHHEGGPDLPEAVQRLLQASESLQSEMEADIRFLGENATSQGAA